MVNDRNTYQPDYAVPPGDILAAELALRGMTRQELAMRTGLTPKHIISILKAGSAITPETAIKFERALGMSADYWLNLEANYQEVCARLAEEQQLIEDLDWLKRIPVAAMVRLGWIEKHNDKKAQLVEVLRFFGIARASQWQQIWPSLNVAYRQSQKQEVFPEAVSAWLRKGELQASRITCQPYDRSRFRTALDHVRELTTKAPDTFVPVIQALCAEAGVAVVFVPALPKTGISGATRWMHKDKAIIQLSLRYKSDDHLWFTFFHEAGHILLHGKKELFLEGNNGLNDKKEQEANRFAEEELIPRKVFSKFVAEGDYSKSAVIAFARSTGIAPGIVVGQLQHKKLLSIKFHNDLKQRYEWT